MDRLCKILYRPFFKEGLHLLGSPSNPEDNQSALVADFREIHSLPIEYISSHTLEIGDRWRLKSPFLEHLF